MGTKRRKPDITTAQPVRKPTKISKPIKKGSKFGFDPTRLPIVPGGATTKVFRSVNKALIRITPSKSKVASTRKAENIKKANLVKRGLKNISRDEMAKLTALGSRRSDTLEAAKTIIQRRAGAPFKAQVKALANRPLMQGDKKSVEKTLKRGQRKLTKAGTVNVRKAITDTQLGQGQRINSSGLVKSKKKKK